MTTRHYVVTNEETGSETLVESNSPGQALRQHVEPLYSVRVARVPDVVRLLHGVNARSATEAPQS